MENATEKLDNLNISSGIAQFTCPICLNITIEPVHTECKHTFCNYCIEELMENFPIDYVFKCPMCRNPIDKNFKIKIDKILDKELLEKFPKEYKEREKIINELKIAKKNVVKIRIIYGNTHELIPTPKKSNSNLEYENKHKWSVYVNIEGEDSEKYIRKVVFGLHPTFGATEQEVKSPPFSMTKIGWGTFEIPIKIYWKYELKQKEPLELTHMLNFNNSGEKKVAIFKLGKKE